VSEFAFNKLNTFISQSNIKNFDLTLRSFNDASATFSLLNNRLVLNGSLFTNTGSSNLFNNNSSTLFNSSFNTLTKDFEAQYLISKNGNLTAKYSYRVLNTTTLNTINQLSAQYVNGIGLVYQKDFDTFGEFFRNFFGGNKRKKSPLTPNSTTDTAILNDKTDTSSNDKSGGNEDQ
jgi:hypothetical protein